MGRATRPRMRLQVKPPATSILNYTFYNSVHLYSKCHHGSLKSLRAVVVFEMCAAMTPHSRQLPTSDECSSDRPVGQKAGRVLQSSVVAWNWEVLNTLMLPSFNQGRHSFVNDPSMFFD